MCGIAFIRLKKDTSWYLKKYQTPYYALDKLYLLMEKQRNRGQDGAGIAVTKLHTPPGVKYINRLRSIEHDSIDVIFSEINQKIKEHQKTCPKTSSMDEWLLKKNPFYGEVMLGHLRYGTHGGLGLDFCHPVIRRNNWKTRNLVIAGNFNLTNNDQLFQELVSYGQHPVNLSDLVTILEKIGHYLDEENQGIYDSYKEKFSKQQISEKIENEINLKKVLQNACKSFDGGYAICGNTGYGSAFIIRDPSGIRPAYYFENEEFVVSASERSAIITAFNADIKLIKEIHPGHALLIDKYAQTKEFEIFKPMLKKSCSFERIYFSRGNDPDIYKERKKLGYLISPFVLKSIKYDFVNTIFSYIPNTAETAFFGMINGAENYLRDLKFKSIGEKVTSNEKMIEILSLKPRIEKIAIKDNKLRTFITNDINRGDMVRHIYDTTFGVVKETDTLVVIDDSIVRGTTLENSILQMLDNLHPKKIIIVSSAPQIRYPDCYGIDMSKMKDFIAFRAAVSLLEKRDQSYLLDEILIKCKEAELNKTSNTGNYVKHIYSKFTVNEISNEIVNLIKKPGIQAEVEIIFQSVENLHSACPNHSGDWYFTGDYPTAGGNRSANRAFINFMEGSLERAY